MQLFLFDDLPHEHVEEEDGRICSRCGIRKKWKHFSFQGTVYHLLKYGVLSLVDGVLENKNYYRKYCLKCSNRDASLAKKLRKTAPPIPDCCDCCGGSFKRVDTKVRKGQLPQNTYLDHCHNTKVFRGWLCNACNTGIGLLGDNLEGLNKAFAYLEKFERSKDV